MQQTASLLRDKISSDMAALQDRMMVAGDISTGSAEIVTDYVSDAMYNKQVAWEAATDAWRAQAEANAGSFQDLIGGIMEAHADAFRTLWGL